MLSFNDTLQKYSDSLDRHLHFIQIGCNDGSMADPINQMVINNCWKGLFVDADIFYLQKAANFYNENWSHNIKDMKLAWYHSAVVTLEEQKTNSTKFKNFYSIKPDAIRPQRIIDTNNKCWWVYHTHDNNIQFLIPTRHDRSVVDHNPFDYLQGIGSLDYNFAMMHIQNAINKDHWSSAHAKIIFTEDVENHKKFIKTQRVPCITINDCFDLSGFQQLDLLQTDMEHWDVKILGDIAEFKLRPNFIHFEAPNGVRDVLVEKFSKCGYKVIKTDRDHLAILNGVLDDT